MATVTPGIDGDNLDLADQAQGDAGTTLQHMVALLKEMLMAQHLTNIYLQSIVGEQLSVEEYNNES